MFFACVIFSFLVSQTTESEGSRDTSKSANTNVSYLQSMGKEILEGYAHKTRLAQEKSVSLHQPLPFTDRVLAEPCDPIFKPPDVTGRLSLFESCVIVHTEKPIFGVGTFLILHI